MQIKRAIFQTHKGRHLKREIVRRMMLGGDWLDAATNGDINVGCYTGDGSDYT